MNISPTVLWFCIAMACFALEIFTPTFVLMFFGAGALAASAFSFFIHDLQTELLIFSIVSVASLFLFRKKLLSVWGRTHASSPQDTSPQGQPGQSGQTGRTGKVTRAISVDGEGEIAMGGSFWRAVADEALPEGTFVKVVGHAPDNEIVMYVARHEPAQS